MALTTGRQVARFTLIYGFGVVTQRLVSFIMLPIYTRYLTPADYGVLELLEMTLAVVGIVATGGVIGVFKFYQDRGDDEARAELVSTAAVSRSSLGAIVALLGWLFAPELTSLVLGADTPALYFRLVFLAYLFQVSAVVPLNHLRLIHKPGLFVAASAIQLVLALTGNIYFVVVRGMNVEGVLWGGLIAKAAVAMALGGFTLRRVGLHFSWSTVRQLTRYGSPLILWGLADFVVVFSDRFFLKAHWDLAVVGVYSLAYKFPFLLSSLALGPFRMTWQPMRFEAARRPDAPAFFGRVFLLVNCGLALLALAIALGITDLLRIMAAEPFWGAADLVPILLVAQVFISWTSLVDVGLLLRERTGWFALLAAVSVAATLGINQLLIPSFGAPGAAWATLAIGVVRFGSVYSFAQRAYRIPYPWGRIVALFAIAAATGGLHWSLRPEALLLSMTFAAVLWAAAFGLVWRVVLTDADRLSLREFVGDAVGRLLARTNAAGDSHMGTGS